MRRLKNQAGNTLIISVILLVLFSVIGLSIMTLTMNGISKNEVRENNIQAAAFAEKGIDRITQQINLELETELKEKNGLGLSRDNFISTFNTILEGYWCTEDEKKSIIEENKYSVCIKEKFPTYEIYDNTIENETRNLIEFESIGYSGGVKKVLTSKIEMGAEIAPPTLNYVVSSNQDKVKAGGNLELIGGLSIKGDIKVDNVLTTGKLLFDLPKIYPNDDQKKAVIKLGNGFKKYNWNSLFSSDSSYEITKFTPEYSNLGIEDFVTNFNNGDDTYSTRVYEGKGIILPHFPISPTLKETDGNIKPLGKVCTWVGFRKRCVNKENPNGPFEINGVNIIKKFTTNADLNINNANVTIKEGLYVGGNLNILGDVTLDGPLYVNGNVNINGNLKSNSMIYSLKNVNINASKLQPKGEKGSLIILTKGDIKLSFNSMKENKINGFFYAEDKIDIYGIISNIQIEGGISGKNVDLTGAEILKESRLQVNYDKDIIDIYNNLKRKQHIIYKVEPPIVKDREV